jgi:hypothetical protein
MMYSTLLTAKYKFTNKIACYGRGELYEDGNEILTGAVYNQYHKLVGINLVGATLGFEYKPADNSYFRIEGRALETDRSEESIFIYQHRYIRSRYELLMSMGVWF